MKPRVLFVDHAGVLGGAELYLLDVVCRLSTTGHVVLFEKGPFLDRLQREAIPVSVLQAPDSVLGVDRSGGRMQDLMAIPGVLHMVGQLRRLVRAYDVLYANSQKALIIGALAGRLARRPVIWNLHDMLTADHFSPGHRRIAVAFANRWVDRVIVNSEATRRAFITCGGDEKKTSIIYNGIDAAPFEAVSDADVRALREELGIAGKTTVGLFSRLTPWKGQHVLVEALAALPDVHALLVGGALFQDDAEYERRLQKLVKDVGVEDRVHFLGFREDIPLLMKSVDIVVHCSTSPEPFGRVIVEGMLAGRPVVAAGAGGALEIVTDGENGLLVTPGDPRSLVEAIARLQAAPDDMRAMAGAGYRTAHRRFALDGIVRSIEEEIRTVTGDPHALTSSSAA